MYRIACQKLLLTPRIVTNISVVSLSDVVSNLPNPCIAMGPDSNHIVCYHPEKKHPYEYTKPIDRNDASFSKVRRKKK